MAGQFKVQLAPFDKPGIPGLEIMKPTGCLESQNSFKEVIIQILPMKDPGYAGYGDLMHHFVNVIDTVYYRACNLRGSGGLLRTSHLFSFPDNLGFLTGQIVQNTFVHNMKSDIRHEHHRNIHKHKTSQELRNCPI